MTTYYAKVDIIWKGVPFLIYPDEWNAYKTHVGAYDDEAHTCYVYTENEEYWLLLSQSSRVHEITATEYVENIQRLRPLSPDVEINFNITVSTSDRAVVENLLNSKGWSFQIKEQGRAL